MCSMFFMGTEYSQLPFKKKSILLPLRVKIRKSPYLNISGSFSPQFQICNVKHTWVSNKKKKKELPQNSGVIKNTDLWSFRWFQSWHLMRRSRLQAICNMTWRARYSTAPRPTNERAGVSGYQHRPTTTGQGMREDFSLLAGTKSTLAYPRLCKAREMFMY